MAELNLADSISEVYKKKWSYVNSFGVQILFPELLLERADWKDYKSEDLQFNLIACSTPQMTNAPIETFIGDKWYIHNSRDELYRITMTFRDEDQMRLYRKFVSLYKNTRDLYFDEAKAYIVIYKDADWISDKVDKDVVFVLEDAIIENVSQVDFNTTTENQIAEFSVGFKSPTCYIN